LKLGRFDGGQSQSNRCAKHFGKSHLGRVTVENCGDFA